VGNLGWRRVIWDERVIFSSSLEVLGSFINLSLLVAERYIKMTEDFINAEQTHKCFKKMSNLLIKSKKAVGDRAPTEEESSVVTNGLMKLQNEYEANGSLAFLILQQNTSGNLSEEGELFLQENKLIVEKVGYLSLLDVSISTIKFRNLTSIEKNKIFSCLEEYMEVAKNYTKDMGERAAFEQLEVVQDKYGRKLGGIAKKMLNIITTKSSGRVH
jgi:hypothetical protein